MVNKNNGGNDVLNLTDLVVGIFYGHDYPYLFIPSISMKLCEVTEMRREGRLQVEYIFIELRVVFEMTSM